MSKIYTIEKDKIIIKDLSQFCIKHILECGQVFRFIRNVEKENQDIKYCYTVYSLDKKAEVMEYSNYAEIVTENVEYFINYFDLNTDYSLIKQHLISYSIIKKAIEYGYGIRILNQDFVETVVSFIISANNNIKRIQKSLNLICEHYGEKIDDYYAFPSLIKLSQITEQDFRSFGVGFRDKYLVDTIKELKNININNLLLLETQNLSNDLQKFKGVGQKVADCIMLFSCHKMNVFPVDTWIKQVFNSFYNNKNEKYNVKQIREFLLNKFGDLSGYAQQYLFYYKREMK